MTEADHSDHSDRTLDPSIARELLRQAREARTHAYAPYSGFRVGAALLARDGRVFTGVNVENASYGLTTCAERTAVTRAITEGAREFLAIAVTGPDDGLGTPPCGSCRQILHEAEPALLVVTPGEGDEPVVTPLPELLPGAFGGERLTRRGEDRP
jgi:cytidine deaminase